MGNFLLPWKEFTAAAIVAPHISGEPRNISGCPLSQNFGNRWVANPSIWVTPSLHGSIEAPQSQRTPSR